MAKVLASTGLVSLALLAAAVVAAWKALTWTRTYPYTLQPVEYPYTFHWKNTPEREKLFGKRCRILGESKQRSQVLVEFEDGKTEVVSQRALRREEP